MKRIIWSAVLALIAFALCVFLPTQALRELWRITEAMDAADITPIIAQLRDVALTPGYAPAAVCAALVFAIAYFLHRHKIIAGILMFLVLLLGLVGALLTVESSNIPLHTILQILIEYVQLGAF